MLGNASTRGRVVARRKPVDEVTIPVTYPAGVPPLEDDTTITVVTDPAEMQMTAQAMMFVDTGIVMVSKSDVENGVDPFSISSAPES
jgi:hypothetical protein